MIAALPFIAPQAQETDPNATTETGDPLQNLDPLTRAVERNPLTLIRIAALGLKDPAHQGEALSGLVAAFLARDKPDDAAIEMKAITDPLWRARALLHVADDQKKRGRLKTSEDTLGRSLKLAGGDQIARDGGATVMRIAERYLDLRAFQAATDTTLLIPDKYEQVRLLLRIATTLRQGKVAALKKDSQKVLGAAFKVAKGIKPDTKDSITTLIRIAEFQVGAGDRPGSRATLAYAEGILEKTSFEGRDQLRADLAAALVLINDRVAAQAIVRSMVDTERKARTIASIARASAQKGNMEAGVSLFTLAYQEALAITEKPSKYRALTHIVTEQSKVGRLADAFRNAGVIRDREPQARALLEMGRVLIKQKKFDEAIKLVDYIPYVGMRSQIFAPVALSIGRGGDRVKASELLAKAFAPTRFRASPEELAKALPMVIEAQSKVGSASMNEALFERVRAQLDRLPDDPSKIQVLTGIAIAEARSERRTAALRALAAAWRISWLNRKNPKYPNILTNLMRAQIEVGELLQAFDTAARVPDSETPPKPVGQLEASLNARNQALQRVAVAAAQEGRQRLSLRAARRIRDIAARARVYGEIAKAFPARKIEKVDPKKREAPRAEPIREPAKPVKEEETTAKTPPKEAPHAPAKAPAEEPAPLRLPKADAEPAPTPEPETGPKPLTPQTN
ncbi:MAG: hypothetical protein CMM48_09935 [Rhodospirillaceae bacterium]|nr:hypothetical protein [Rhodospirillaceae bacterium]HAA91372.1 hypothetical protein [Rhodospirillaceae bacterium]